MKNPDDLSVEEKEILKNVFALNPALGCIYELRKELKGIFDLDITKEEAKQKVEEWEKGSSIGYKTPKRLYKDII